MIHFVTALLFSITAGADCTTRLRAVFDVGSGTTKLNVSEVEVCPHSNRVLRVLDNGATRAVPLERGKDASGAIPEANINRLVHALKQLKQRALRVARQKGKGQSEIEFSAAGTHALRTAANTAAVVERVAALGIPLTVLSQEEEAIAGVSGVKAEACAGKQILVWDVGGGSTQLTRLATDPKVTGLPVGAEPFKKKLMAELAGPRGKLRCRSSAPTPNPIGLSNFDKAVKLAAQEAKDIPAELKEGKFCVIGIGGIHNKAVEDRLNQLWNRVRHCACPKENRSCKHRRFQFSKKEAECLGRELAEKTDCDSEIKGPYSTTSVSNVFLVLGFMEMLGIDEIHTENVNMGDGLASDRRILKFQSEPLKQR